MKKTILIVEDDKLMSKALEDKLMSSGFSVLMAKNGVDGLNKAIKEKPDLILLDVMMPKMDGMGMMEQLRSDEWGQKVPIIFLTSVTPDDDMLKKLVSGGAAHFFNKSQTNLSELIDKINCLFDESED